MRSSTHDPDPWCSLIPLVHRMLADPEQIANFPDVTRINALEDACAVWETLHYLLTDLLGWKMPGRGLAWWYSADKPIADSPILALMRSLWDQNHQLDYYAAFAFRQGATAPPGQAWSRQNLATHSLFKNDEWWNAFFRRPVPEQPNPWFGGTNSLHLGHSSLFGEDNIGDETFLFHFDLTARRAVLIVNHLGSWKRELRHAADLLPALKDRSWHVEIFDRCIGYLGLFRLSRMTGHWFQGLHSVHMRGN